MQTKLNVNEHNKLRQGDVWLERIDVTTDSLVPVKPEGGRYKLAEGEATGHAHAIRAQRGVKMYEDELGFVLKVVGEIITVDHEEHAPLYVPPGTWRVIHQREYTPEA